MYVMYRDFFLMYTLQRHSGDFSLKIRSTNRYHRKLHPTVTTSLGILKVLVVDCMIQYVKLNVDFPRGLDY